MLEEQLREELIGLLDDGWAHAGPERLLADFPLDRINEYPPNAPYTPWHLLEHMRFCQQELLELIEAEVMPDYTWPDDFWPATDRMATAQEWTETLEAFFTDLQRLKDLAMQGDLMSPCRHNPKASLLHALFNIAAHNHHHLGEFAILRQVMGTWPADRNATG